MSHLNIVNFPRIIARHCEQWERQRPLWSNLLATKQLYSHGFVANRLLLRSAYDLSHRNDGLILSIVTIFKWDTLNRFSTTIRVKITHLLSIQHALVSKSNAGNSRFHFTYVHTGKNLGKKEIILKQDYLQSKLQTF